MFIGHFAPAIVAATHKDSPNLPTLFFGAQLVDWGFFTLLLFGVENMRIVPGITVMNPFDLYHMPYTHSVLGSTLWAVVFAILVYSVTRRWKAALIGGAVVMSHWVLDWLVHGPDLTLIGSPPKWGLGLWNHPGIEMPLELAITGGALWLYARVAKPDSKRLVTLAILLLAVQAMDWFGPPPAAVTPVLSVMALSAYALLTLAAWWVDGSRRDRHWAGSH